ncbi:hypothetical protein [Nocardioides baculatus]|uniref:ESX secretion-associated protein EspG n=1 Tax=Nocardioides baculatus TaxID=2801337 RepID=A0ABS1LDQ2_9ACTN|nr:hypothetical protein [Nocardioides baculatus]MBL0749814.1 hypothetical protein [Nocardioides baculatus]
MITLDGAAVRVDDAGLAGLLGDDLGAEDRDTLARAALLPSLDTLRDPLVRVEVRVAGAVVLEHRFAVDRERTVAVLAVRPGLHQLMELPQAHLAAALARTTRTGPRRGTAAERRPAPAGATSRLLSADDDVRHEALREVGATSAWRLRVHWAGEHRDLVVADAADGLLVVDEDDALLPVSATSLYRVFTTALPPEALEPAG